MSNIKPFASLRPEAQLAKQVASKPYDVLNSAEAKIEAQGNPASFLHITKSEIGLADDIDIHAQLVYDKAKENLEIGELFLAATSGIKLPLGVFGRFAKGK